MRCPIGGSSGQARKSIVFSDWRIVPGQLQPDSSPAVRDGRIKRLSALQIQLVAASCGHLDDLGRFFEGDPAGQRRFQVFFQKLAVLTVKGGVRVLLCP